MNRSAALVSAVSGNLVILLWLSVIGCDHDGSGLHVEPMKLDLGTVSAGTHVQRGITVSNRGLRDLTPRLSSCCGVTCLTPLKRIPARSESRMVLAVDVPITAGTFERVVQLRASEFPNWSTSISVSGTVPPGWTPSPGELAIQEVPEGASRLSRILLHLDAGAPPPTQATSDIREVRPGKIAMLSPVLYSIPLHVTVPDKTHEDLRAQVTVSDGRPGGLRRIVNVRVGVVPCYSVVPSQVTLGEVSPFEPVAAGFQLKGSPVIEAMPGHLPPIFSVRLARHGPTRIDGHIRAEGLSAEGPLVDQVNLRVKTHHTFNLGIPVTGFVVR